MTGRDPYTLDLMERAWDRVRKGSPIPGSDRIDLKRFQRGLRRRLRSLCNALNQSRYVPEAGLGIRIPKSDGSLRLLMVPSIRDRVAQAATVELLQPAWEARFLDCSYGYRPGKGHHKALGRVEHHLRSGREWVTTADIDDFFGSIQHNLLLRQLGEAGAPTPVLHAVELWLKMGYVGEHGLEVQAVGVPQGALISPLLANVYLHPFDVALRMRGYEHVRYADDYVILCRSQREANEAYRFAAEFLESQLKLRLNQQDEPCRHLQRGFVFLGLLFQGHKRRIAPEKLEKAKRKLQELCDGLRDAELPELVVHLNALLRAWQYYYQRCNDRRSFQELDDALNDAVLRWAKRRQKPVSRGERRALLNLERMVDRTPRARVLANRELLSDVSAVLGQQRHGAKARKRARGGVKPASRVEGRRRHYDRKAATVSLLVVKPGGVVGVSGDQVRVRREGRVVCTRSLRRLRHIVLAGQRISLSSDLLNRCAEYGVRIETVDFSGRTVACMSSPTYGQPGVWEAQLAARAGKKGKIVARAFVVGKIENQLRLLKYWDKYWKRADPALHRLFLEESQIMLEALRAARQTVVGGTALEADRLWAERLRGFEGMAAASYWAVVARTLPAQYGFGGRAHQGADDPVNQMLNYGYGVLYGRAHAALSAAGLNPHWGFLHRGAKKPALVYDFVDMFRPWAVDRVVVRIAALGGPAEVTNGRLTDATRHHLLAKVLERLARSIRYRSRRLTLEEIMVHQGEELAAFLKGDVQEYRPFLAHW